MSQAPRWTWQAFSHHFAFGRALPISHIFPRKHSYFMKMSSTVTGPNEVTIDKSRLDDFHAHLRQSTRVLALCGAGLSASSGLPTFRGPGGLWRTHSSMSLATPGAFEENPGLVWQYVLLVSTDINEYTDTQCYRFYNYRRHMALSVQPNAAHYALAELACKMPGFQCLSQNVDGLSQRAEHPPEQLQLLHGTLFDLKCSWKLCTHRETSFTDPVVPALAIPTDGGDPTTHEARSRGKDLDISDPNVPIPKLQYEDLPICPKCQEHILRPGVVWFGENLPREVLHNVNSFLEERTKDLKPVKIDLIMVIGTSAKVFPAAGYIDEAREKGARVCVVNMDANDAPPSGWKKGDWMFQGDAAVIVPELLRPIIGDVKGKV